MMKSICDCFKFVVLRAINSLYGISNINIEIQPTKNEFRGHITLIILPLKNIINKSIIQISKEIGKYVKKHLFFVHSFYFIKGFLNFEFSEEYYYSLLKEINREYFFFKTSEEKALMIEYSSPNSNKPLHLGHIRNNLLGSSLFEIFKATGNNVIKIQIINDRGIQICKSVLGWKKFSFRETPNYKYKGDHLVGKYYVAFEKAYKIEKEYLNSKGYNNEFIKKQTPIIKEVRKLLILWEKGNIELLDLWKRMNVWVYRGFEQTYSKLDIKFDETQYESKTYLFGKNIIEKGLKKGVFFKKKDESIWIDLSKNNLDDKLLLRSDGTTVYLTQDLGTTIERFELYSIKFLIYIVGEEQQYHFKVLFFILHRLGYYWVNNLFHLSYGLINLTSGRMKSREGIIIDADNLLDEMHKLSNFMTFKKKREHHYFGIGAMKYHILKIDTKKNILFDPKSSIDFNGNTGIYLQYSYTRISSLHRKVYFNLKNKNYMIRHFIIGRHERSLIKVLIQYVYIIFLAKKSFNPAIIATIAYNLAKTFNDLYQNVCIINYKKKLYIFRLFLTKECGKILKKCLKLLSIELPEFI